MVDLSVEIAGIRMKNPVMVASGTFGFGLEYAQLFDLSRLGAIVTKALTVEPWPGNPPPRIWETPAGLLNAIGLQNPGVEVFADEILPELKKFDIPVIANIAGFTKEEFAELASRLTGTGVSGLEVNISCPNVKAGGMVFGTVPELAAEVVEAVVSSTSLPVIVKLTPNVTDIVAVAKAVVEAGAHALSLINTLLGMAIDIHRKKPVLANVTGGLSGPAIRPVAVRAVWQVSQAVDVPVVGMGGICTGSDALEFILAGATAVAVGSANFYDPLSSVKVVEEIENYCIEHGVESLHELVGAAWKN
ncbi:MAG: Dihydroorotate dehydrogenase [Thermoanaerobacterales bacterium 50_218]|nr:MAG: Dihydroorotate dehydrogenase [Thermoanaerobacterales bacterium 50_218]HAA89254.1 dihydroorotate dehydrogenase [Peptococcaceae bacterium]